MKPASLSKAGEAIRAQRSLPDTSLSSFFIITQTLLNHVVTADLQSYRVECMRNLEPLCCEAQCGWQLDNITEDSHCVVSGNHMTCVFDNEKRNLSTPSELRKITPAARCNIYNTKGFHMSCHHEGKPICCDTPCECELNLLNATCTIQDKSMECSCAGSASDDPVLHSCFKNLHKTTSRACDFKAGDTCYISTGATDGKGQKRKSEQVSDEDKKEIKDNNVTPKPDNQPSANNNAFWIGGISGISGFVLGILIGWLYCYLTRKCSICGSCCENQKKLDHKRKESFSEDKDKESKTKDDEEDTEEMKEEECNPCLPQHEQSDREKNMRHRISSTSESEASGSADRDRTETLY